MGMYTEIHVAGDIPLKHPALEVIQHLFADGPHPAHLPEHPFFECPRWDHIGSVASFYLSPVPLRGTTETAGDLYFHSVSNIKNYDGEIEKFFDWLRAAGIRHYGHSRYEETLEQVTLYHFEGP